ncbi:MAG TPA: hypothetical protein VGB97_02870 [Candidatus Paceibacterota bacterium]|jgi:hypothetical protein
MKNLRGKSFKAAGIALVLLALVLLFLVHQGYLASVRPAPTPELSGQESAPDVTPPTFVWKYEKVEALDLDGLPQTNIFLQGTYANGVVQTSLIDMAPGGCADAVDVDDGSLPGSTNAQCYSAGLGYRYRVIEGPSGYLVERKTFEEALPDHTPPAYAYEVVAEFPL